ncbi:MAG: heavy metal translocating P-type ATPase [Pedosphaera sp. Tous-C6FEB]|nr:MAG: heavy metal translocating P-type ATPase [Pedosphaera sp. Tous-C6FEB]
MSGQPPSSANLANAGSSSGRPSCLARSVAAMLAREPALEGVTVHRTEPAIAVATLGNREVEGLADRVTAAVAAGRQTSERHRCQLLQPAGNCAECDIPLSAAEHQTVTIQREGDRSVIARLTCPTAPSFWRWRNLPLPKIVPREVEIPEAEADLDEWKPQMVAAGLCGAATLTAALVGEGPVQLSLHLAAYLAGGWFAAHEVWERLQHRVLDVHFLMLAVALGSALIGHWDEGAMLLFLFSISGALEHYAMGRTQREIGALFKAAPKTATQLDDAGHEHEVPVADLQPGVRLLIKPGAQFPVDAEVVKGKTAADESTLTGEAAPVEKNVGDSVLAGTLNLWGAVEVLVLRAAGQSALQRIIRLIREAQRLKAPSQRFTDKFGSGYTYAITGLALAMFFVWWLGFGLPAFTSVGEMQSAFYRTMALLVVASPCALVLSIPSAVLAAIAWGARRGILFRGGAAIEQLAVVNVVALDKTGTLTTGELQVEKVESFPPGREQEVATLACAMERLSTHPLARAITRYGKQLAVKPLVLDHFESITGLGLRAQLGEKVYLLGRRELVLSLSRSRSIQPKSSEAKPLLPRPVRNERGEGRGEGQSADLSPQTAGQAPPLPNPLLQSMEEREKTVPPTAAGISEVWVSDGELLGRILLRDDIRPQAADVLTQLRRSGLQTVVLTGDRPEAAELLKRELHFDELRAGLKPEQKVAAIRAYTEAGQRVAMVGDGVNDAPSLAAAHVGVAMGARGSDAALEQAQVVLMHDRLENFLAAYRLSQRARAVIRQNVFISLGTVVVLVGFALFGKVPLTLGVLGHEGSTVIVVLNSLRLLLWPRA